MRKRFDISSQRVQAMEQEYAFSLMDSLSSPVKCLLCTVCMTSLSNRLQELRQRPVDLATLKANLKGECNALHGEMFKRFADLNVMFKVHLSDGIVQYNTIQNKANEWNMADILYEY